MYATIVRCDMRSMASSQERGLAARTLAARLTVLHGSGVFVAFEARDGEVTALCIVEDEQCMEEVNRLTARWHSDVIGMSGSGIQQISSGEVIAQKGL